MVPSFVLFASLQHLGNPSLCNLQANFLGHLLIFPSYNIYTTSTTMKTILVINRPQIEAYWTLPFLFLKIQTNYNKVLEAEDKYWLKNIAKHLDSNPNQKFKIVFNDLSDRKRNRITIDEPYLILPNVQVIHLL